MLNFLLFAVGLVLLFGGVGYSEISEGWTGFWLGIAEAVLGVIFLLLFLLLRKSKDDVDLRLKKHPWPRR